MLELRKQAKDRQEPAQLTVANEQTDAITVALRINRDSLAFWKQLIEKLRISISFLRDTLELDGDISISDSANGELLCRLDVELYAAMPKSVFLNLLYRPGGRIIRYCPQAREPSELPFSLDNDDVVLVFNDQNCNAEQAAECLLGEMIWAVKPDACLSFSDLLRAGGEQEDWIHWNSATL